MEKDRDHLQLCGNVAYEDMRGTCAKEFVFDLGGPLLLHVLFEFLAILRKCLVHIDISSLIVIEETHYSETHKLFEYQLDLLRLPRDNDIVPISTDTGSAEPRQLMSLFEETMSRWYHVKVFSISHIRSFASAGLYIRCAMLKVVFDPGGKRLIHVVIDDFVASILSLQLMFAQYLKGAIILHKIERNVLKLFELKLFEASLAEFSMYVWDESTTLETSFRTFRLLYFGGKGELGKMSLSKLKILPGFILVQLWVSLVPNYEWVIEVYKATEVGMRIISQLLVVMLTGTSAHDFWFLQVLGLVWTWAINSTSFVFDPGGQRPKLAGGVHHTSHLCWQTRLQLILEDKDHLMDGLL